MISDISEYHSSPIPPSDICIVGTGAAGMELAHQLSRTSLSVTMLESGREEFDWNIQKLCRFKQVGRKIRSADHSQFFDLSQASQQESRIRQLGGTLNVWGKRWKMLDPFDLLPKPYLNESGWPLDYERDLLPYYQSVAQDYDVSEIMQQGAILSQLPLMTKQVSSLVTSVNLKNRLRIDLKGKFHHLFDRSDSFRLILRANAVEILLGKNLRHVDCLIVRSLEGGEWKVKARRFVLACGSIENARLLLCSNKQHKAGIGNGSGWVGRNLMDIRKEMQEYSRFFQGIRSSPKDITTQSRNINRSDSRLLFIRIFLKSGNSRITASNLSIGRARQMQTFMM